MKGEKPIFDSRFSPKFHYDLNRKSEKLNRYFLDFFRARFARFFSVDEGGRDFLTQRSGLKFFKNSGEPVTSKSEEKRICVWVFMSYSKEEI